MFESLKTFLLKYLPFLDVNKDGKVDVADVKAAVSKTKARAKKAADVDGDGKVTKADAKAAVKKIRNRKSKA